MTVMCVKLPEITRFTRLVSRNISSIAWYFIEKCQRTNCSQHLCRLLYCTVEVQRYISLCRYINSTIKVKILIYIIFFKIHLYFDIPVACPCPKCLKLNCIKFSCFLWVDRNVTECVKWTCIISLSKDFWDCNYLWNSASGTKWHHQRVI